MKKYIEVKENAPEYGKRIAKILNDKNCNVTQAILAKKAGISTGAMSNLIHGVNTPSIDVIQRIANYLNVSVDYLLGNTDIKAPNLKLQAIEKYTGLSEQAIKVLLKLKKENRKTAYCDIISTIIENGNCEYFLAMIGKRISLHSDKKGLQGNELVKNMIERTMYLDIDGTRSAVYKDSLIDSILQTEFVKLLPVVSDEYLDKYPTTPSQRESEWDSFSRKYAQQVANGEITTEQYNEIIEAWFNKKDGEI